MWRLVSAELKYSRMGILAWLSLAPILGAYEIASRYDAPHPTLLILLSLTASIWLSAYNRERHDALHMTLPVSTRQVALARMAVVLILCTALPGLYGLVHLAFNAWGTIRFEYVVDVYAFTLIVFSVGLMFRDRFIGSKALMRGKMILVGTLLVALVFVMITLMQARRAGLSGPEAPLAVRVIHYFRHHNPLADPLGVLVFLGAGLLMLYLTTHTFAWRRRHLA
jgi:hypothetical protein